MIIIGCGYVGGLVAQALRDHGEAVTGVVRGAQSAGKLRALGVEPLRLDLEHDDLEGLRCGGESVFHFAPPPPQGVEDLAMARLIDSFDRRGHPRRLVYISTTGVYGDCAGAWIDETWPVRPAVDRARRRWDAENALRHWSEANGGELVILRVAGIYGMGRLPLDRIYRGLPLVRPDQAPYTNRIHVVDLVGTLVAAMDRGENGAVYNVSDGHPSSMTEYFLAVADAMGLPRPPLISMEEAPGQVSEGMLSYLMESRRLSNRKLREELGVELRYPTLADGLRAIMPPDRTPPGVATQ